MAWVFWTGAVGAERNLSIYPAAQCAASWAGYSDYGQASAHLDHNPQDIYRASAFRLVALRLATATAEEIDRHIAEQRPLMVSMLDGVFYRSGRTSQKVFDRLTETCARFGAQHPETRDLI